MSGKMSQIPDSAVDWLAPPFRLIFDASFVQNLLDHLTPKNVIISINSDSFENLPLREKW